MDFVAFWKAFSVLLTGLFGILALVTNYRDRDSNKVTTWGWVALVGILLSTTGGVVAQFEETRSDARKALAIAEKSDKTLRNISRLLTPLNVTYARVGLSAKCADSPYSKVCERIARKPVHASETVHGKFTFYLDIYATAPPGPVGHNRFKDAGMKPDITFACQSISNASIENSPDGIDIQVECGPDASRRNDTMLSTEDLIGATMQVVLTDDLDDPNIVRRLDYLSFGFQNGQHIFIPVGLLKEEVPDPHIGYVYDYRGQDSVIFDYTFTKDIPFVDV
jgi:hypothetical protein